MKATASIGASGSSGAAPRKPKAAPKNDSKKEKKAGANANKIPRPYNSYNIFFMLERELVIRSRNGRFEAHRTTDADDSFVGYYGGLEIPPLPPRYRILGPTLAPNWYVPGLRKRAERKHVKSEHGVVSFKEIPRIVAKNWKSMDGPTREFVEAVAAVLKGRYVEVVARDRLRSELRRLEAEEGGLASAAFCNNIMPVLDGDGNHRKTPDVAGAQVQLWSRNAGTMARRIGGFDNIHQDSCARVISPLSQGSDSFMMQARGLDVHVPHPSLGTAKTRADGVRDDTVTKRPSKPDQQSQPLGVGYYNKRVLDDSEVTVADNKRARVNTLQMKPKQPDSFSKRRTASLAHNHSDEIQTAASRLLADSFLEVLDEMRREGHPDREVERAILAMAAGESNNLAGPNVFGNIMCPSQLRHPTVDGEEENAATMSENSSTAANEKFQRQVLEGVITAKEAELALALARSRGRTGAAPTAGAQPDERDSEIRGLRAVTAELISTLSRDRMQATPTTGTQLDERDTVIKMLRAENAKLERRTRDLEGALAHREEEVALLRERLMIREQQLGGDNEDAVPERSVRAMPYDDGADVEDLELLSRLGPKVNKKILEKMRLVLLERKVSVCGDSA